MALLLRGAARRSWTRLLHAPARRPGRWRRGLRTSTLGWPLRWRWGAWARSAAHPRGMGGFGTGTTGPVPMPALRRRSDAATPGLLLLPAQSAALSAPTCPFHAFSCPANLVGCAQPPLPPPRPVGHRGGGPHRAGGGRRRASRGGGQRQRRAARGLEGGQRAGPLGRAKGVLPAATLCPGPGVCPCASPT
jgi:hypothetical protein